MVSTPKKRQSKRKLLSQINDFNQDIVNGNAATERQENVTVTEGTDDRDFIVGTSSDKSATNENVVIVKTLQRYFNEKVDKK